MFKKVMTIAGLFSALNVAAFSQTKTVTNADLEKFRQKRVQAEKDYRENYEKRGLPSPEELERREEERKRWLSEEARKADLENASSANYFQARAYQLKTQIASIEGQIAYLRGQLGDSSYRGGTVSSGAIFSGYYPIYGNYAYGNFPYRNRRFNQRQVYSPNVQTVQSYGIGTNATDIRNRVNNGNFGVTIRSGYGYHRSHYQGGYYAPVIIDSRNYTRDELVLRLQSLEQTRAGLAAEYSELEEQARRAGVRIE